MKAPEWHAGGECSRLRTGLWFRLINPVIPIVSFLLSTVQPCFPQLQILRILLLIVRIDLSTSFVLSIFHEINKYVCDFFVFTIAYQNHQGGNCYSLTLNFREEHRVSQAPFSPFLFGGKSVYFEFLFRGLIITARRATGKSARFAVPSELFV